MLTNKIVIVAHTVATVSWIISSQLFTRNLQRKDCQQLDSTIIDAPLQALGFDKSNTWPIDSEDPPS